MARSDVYTDLGLTEFAVHPNVGMNPIYFNGAYVPDVFPVCDCVTLFRQKGWQGYSYQPSLDLLAQIIHDSEKDLNSFLGYSIASRWEDDVVVYPSVRVSDCGGGRDRYGLWPQIKLDKRRVIALGRRGIAEIAIASPVVYEDRDGDGFAETGVIAIAGDSAEFGDKCQIKVYYPAKDGDRQWEIGKVERKFYDEIDGKFVIEIKAWEMIGEDCLNGYVTPCPDNSDPSPFPIDISDPACLLQFVDVYREYNDQVSPSVVFYSKPSLCGCCLPSCPSCSVDCSFGCARIVDGEQGTIEVFPATYNEAENRWIADPRGLQKQPLYVRVFYYAGATDEDRPMAHASDPTIYCNPAICHSRHRRLTSALVNMVLARLPHENCVCGCPTENHWDRLRLDAAGAIDERLYGAEYLSNSPFGTRVGELEAWRLALNYARSIPAGMFAGVL